MPVFILANVKNKIKTNSNIHHSLKMYLVQEDFFFLLTSCNHSKTKNIMVFV